jgi:hypothetical protein
MMFKPDDFARRPYGFTTNQISHAAAVGFLFIVYGLSLACVWVFGEYPYKWQIAVIGGVGYLAYELFAQGWQGWDTAEDWWFVNVYGIWAPLAAFSEAPPEVAAITGQFTFVGDLFAALPFIAVFGAHLALGAFMRWRRSR